MKKFNPIKIENTKNKIFGMNINRNNLKILNSKISDLKLKNLNPKISDIKIKNNFLIFNIQMQIGINIIDVVCTLDAIKYINYINCPTKQKKIDIHTLTQFLFKTVRKSWIINFDQTKSKIYLCILFKYVDKFNLNKSKFYPTCTYDIIKNVHNYNIKKNKSKNNTTSKK